MSRMLAQMMNSAGKPIGAPSANFRYAHELVVAQAKEFAGVLFEQIMWDNKAFEAWREVCPDLTTDASRDEFIRLMWPHLLDDARAIMAKMLGQPGKEHLKPSIHDALMKDALVRPPGPPKPLFFGRESQKDARE